MHILGNADPGIRHFKADTADLFRFGDERDANADCPLLGEFDRVADKVEQDLADSRRIAPEAARGSRIDQRPELQSLLRRLRREQRRRTLHDLDQIEVDRFELDLAGFELRDIEDVVDDGQQRFRTVAHHLGIFALFRGQAGVQQQSVHAENPVHRRADLVAHIGQELGFGPVRGLRLFLCVRKLFRGGPMFRHVGIGPDRAAARQRDAADFQHSPVRPPPLVDVRDIEHAAAADEFLKLRVHPREFARAVLKREDVVEAGLRRHEFGRQVEQLGRPPIADRHRPVRRDHQQALIHVVERDLQDAGLFRELSPADAQLGLAHVQPLSRFHQDRRLLLQPLAAEFQLGVPRGKRGLGGLKMAELPVQDTEQDEHSRRRRERAEADHHGLASPNGKYGPLFPRDRDQQRVFAESPARNQARLLSERVPCDSGYAPLRGGLDPAAQRHDWIRSVRRMARQQHAVAPQQYDLGSFSGDRLMEAREVVERDRRLDEPEKRAGRSLQTAGQMDGQLARGLVADRGAYEHPAISVIAQAAELLAVRQVHGGNGPLPREIDHQAIGADDHDRIRLGQPADQPDQQIVGPLVAHALPELLRRGDSLGPREFEHLAEHDIDALDRAGSLLGESGRERIEILLRVRDPILVQRPDGQTGRG